MYDRRVNKKGVIGGKTGSQNEGDDSQFFFFFGPFQLSRVNGSIVKTVIIFSSIHTDRAYTVTNYRTRHSTMDTPIYST